MDRLKFVPILTCFHVKLQAALTSRCKRTESMIARWTKLEKRFFWGWRLACLRGGDDQGVQRGWCNPSSLAAWK
jgi:hypothetical protein